MNREEIKEKLKKEKGLGFVCEVRYNEKKYIKAIKSKDIGVSYVYLENVDGKICEIEDKETLNNLKELYNLKSDGKIYEEAAGDFKKGERRYNPEVGEYVRNFACRKT